jgi:hypothetical protein
MAIEQTGLILISRFYRLDDAKEGSVTRSFISKDHAETI